MHRFAAAILALSVMQPEPAPTAPAASPTPAEAPPPAPSAPPAPAATPEPAEPPAPRAPAAAPPAPSAAPAAPAPRPPPPARPAASPTVSAPAPAPTPAVVPPAPAPLPPAPPPRPQAKPAQGAPPVSQRDRLLGAALGFLDALLRGDASDLAAASSLRFSFDGTFVEGRDAQARRWREILAARGQVAEQKLRDLVLLTDEEAIAQLGQPPARLAPLVRPGTWVAVADVSGRPVVLFLVEEGNRVAVAGMHD